MRARRSRSRSSSVVLATGVAAPLGPSPPLRSRASYSSSSSSPALSSSSSAPAAAAARRSARNSRGPPVSKGPLPAIFQNFWFLTSALVASLCWLLLALLWLWYSYQDDIFYSPDPSPSSSPGVKVTYGSLVKLMHHRTKFRLHSHNIPYGSGSGQQSVTGFGGVHDSNSYWIVKVPVNSLSQEGDEVVDGSVIRLQHMRTRKWLHSHAFPSPISGNFEVSCFGGEEESDTGDLWVLEIQGKSKVWTMHEKVRIRHVDTGALLFSHDKKYAQIATGQQEVCGVRERTTDSFWIAAEGVYLPVKDKVAILS